MDAILDAQERPRMLRPRGSIFQSQIYRRRAVGAPSNRRPPDEEVLRNVAGSSPSFIARIMMPLLARNDIISGGGAPSMA